PDGSKDWINPADVEVQRDERDRITGATLIADGQNPDGSKDWINPADVEVQRDERDRITGATLIADGQ
ncbi:hypothetical protein C7E12_23590, partial [Stenotrophomonas maltophilia]